MEKSLEEKITIRPDYGQFIVNEGLLVMIPPLLLAYFGIGVTILQIIISAISAIMCLYLLFSYIYITNIKYEIDDERITISKGIINIDCDYIELYRVVDYDEKRSLFQRIFDIKTVNIYSGDRTLPKLAMAGVDGKLDLVRIIRSRVEKSKMKHGIYEITNR